MIIARTHGGLGNQMFQIGHAMLRARAVGVSIVRRHDTRHATVFAATPAFAELDGPLALPLAGLSWLRLPKLLTRSRLRCDALTFGRTVLLDGYFQRAGDWAAPDEDIQAVLGDFRRRFEIVPGAGSGTVVHLRLGDFFTDDAAQRVHLATRLADLPAVATLITNRDDLLAAHAEMLSERGLLHQPTTGMPPESLLALMAGFADIKSNDSTLAIWAALLGRARMAISHPPLRDVHAAIARADR